MTSTGPIELSRDLHLGHLRITKKSSITIDMEILTPGKDRLSPAFACTGYEAVVSSIEKDIPLPFNVAFAGCAFELAAEESIKGLMILLGNTLQKKHASMALTD
jgi:hypothetical protein